MGLGNSIETATLRESSEIPPLFLPSNLSVPLGRALRQLIRTPSGIIKINLAGLSQNIPPGNETHRGWIEGMEKSIERIDAIIEGLQDRQVMMIKLLTSGAGGWDFGFLEKINQREQQIKPGVVVLDPDLTSQVTAALTHNLNNALNQLNFSQWIQRIAPTEAVKEQATSIVLAAKQIRDAYRPFQDARQLQIRTESSGLTTVIPIFPPAQGRS